MRWVMLLGFWWTLQQAPEVHVDPDTGDRYQLERPPEGAARGRWPVPAWVVWSVGGVLVVGASGVLVARIRRSSSREKSR